MVKNSLNPSRALSECYRYPYLRRVNDCFVAVAEDFDDDVIVGGGAFDCSLMEADVSGGSDPMAPVLLPVSSEFALAQSSACEVGVAGQHQVADGQQQEATFASAKVIDWRKKHEETVVVFGCVRSESGRAVALLQRWRLEEEQAFEPGLGDFFAEREKILPQNASFYPYCGAMFVFAAIAKLLSFPKQIQT